MISVTHENPALKKKQKNKWVYKVTHKKSKYCKRDELQILSTYQHGFLHFYIKMSLSSLKSFFISIISEIWN